jgi:hypothetical protein
MGRRLEAYYYGFEPTGNDAVDKILGAVACAGKAIHNTAEWNEELGANYDDHTGATPIDWIQNAANEAASTNPVREYLEQMDNELIARDGSAELTHEEAKQALRNAYLISCGKPREFHNI